MVLSEVCSVRLLLLLLQLHRRRVWICWSRDRILTRESIVSYRLAVADVQTSISLAQILLTAVPESLRQIAATNLPAVSSILWEEFLDDKRPEWFLELPWEIQNYLIRKFGPQTAWPTEAPASSGLEGSGWSSATVSRTATD